MQMSVPQSDEVIHNACCCQRGREEPRGEEGPVTSVSGEALTKFYTVLIQPAVLVTAIIWSILLSTSTCMSQSLVYTCYRCEHIIYWRFKTSVTNVVKKKFNMGTD